jgi:hypothetical protein
VAKRASGTQRRGDLSIKSVVVEKTPDFNCSFENLGEQIQNAVHEHRFTTMALLKSQISRPAGHRFHAFRQVTDGFTHASIVCKGATKRAILTEKRGSLSIKSIFVQLFFSSNLRIVV